MTDETSNVTSGERREEAIKRRELIRTIPKGPKRRVAKRMNKQIATIDRMLDEHGPKE